MTRCAVWAPAPLSYLFINIIFHRAVKTRWGGAKGGGGGEGSRGSGGVGRLSVQMRGIPRLPLLSVAELLMSPVMKEDSCFLTVSFHIRRIRLCEGKKGAGDKEAGGGKR